MVLGRGGLSVAEGRFIRLVQKARWWNKLKASDGKISWVHPSSVQFCLCMWILCTVCDWKFYELSRLWPLAGSAGQDKWPLKGWVSLTTVPFHLITHHLVEAKSNMRGILIQSFGHVKRTRVEQIEKIIIQRIKKETWTKTNTQKDKLNICQPERKLKWSSLKQRWPIIFISRQNWQKNKTGLLIT